ncbi:MAG: tetratricopeptide repeat protein [bacterium]|jgi:TolA-binding protein|nr:tetratricopeptide repeat protein [candidate division KSB1 bacterium]MDH7561029.1 tetratricopeptide repeat protein [bacterium]
MKPLACDMQYRKTWPPKDGCAPRRRLSAGLFALLALAVLIISSCAYYNTFYNAEQAFKAAERERKNRKGDTPTSQETSSYNKAIEKASKILELYNTSKHVDDALLMLGKCFYYQGQYAKAERKFDELLALFPGGELAEEALVWRARARISQNQLEQAAADCRQVIATSKRALLRDEAQYLTAEIDFAKEDYRSAVNRFSEAAKRIADREVRSTAYARLGECHLKLKEYLPAARAFQAAAKHTLIDTRRYQATLNIGRALREAGDVRGAESVFLRMTNDQLAKQYWPDAKLEMAACLVLEGDIDEAMQRYEALIKDHPRTDASARAHCALAQLYETRFQEYVKAHEHYDQVKTEAPRCELVPTAAARVADLERLLRLQATIAELMGKTFAVDSLQQSATPARADTVRPEMRDLMALTPEAEPDTALGVFIRGPARQPSPQQPTKKAITPYPDMDLVTAHLQLAELFYFQLSNIDSALAHYWAAYRANPDSSSAAQALYPLAYIMRVAQRDTARSNSLLQEIVTRFPELPQAEGARRLLGLPRPPDQETLAAALFWQADSLLWEADAPESALAAFASLSSRCPESEYAPRALYAIAWVLEQRLHDNERALQAYKRVQEAYPDSPQGKAAKRKIDAHAREAEKLQRLAEAAARPDSSARQAQAPPLPEERQQEEREPLPDATLQQAVPDTSGTPPPEAPRKRP